MQIATQGRDTRLSGRAAGVGSSGLTLAGELVATVSNASEPKRVDRKINGEGARPQALPVWIMNAWRKRRAEAGRRR
jgi:hypothetical protein